jgi:hypothetical protein
VGDVAGSRARRRRPTLARSRSQTGFDVFNLGGLFLLLADDSTSIGSISRHRWRRRSCALACNSTIYSYLHFRVSSRIVVDALIEQSFSYVRLLIIGVVDRSNNVATLQALAMRAAPDARLDDVERRVALARRKSVVSFVVGRVQLQSHV